VLPQGYVRNSGSLGYRVEDNLVLPSRVDHQIEDSNLRTQSQHVFLYVDIFLGSSEIVDYTFALGTHTVTLVVTDSYGETDDDETTIVVQDTTQPTINSISADPAVLWPPNHKMVEVIVTVDAEDICDATPACNIINVTSNEPINGLGDGNTEPDREVTGDLSVKLRAEHAGGGTGRVYTIHIACTDVSGNTATATVEVNVPHDQGKGKK
jgi:hypothetical protein